MKMTVHLGSETSAEDRIALLEIARQLCLLDPATRSTGKKEAKP